MRWSELLSRGSLKATALAFFAFLTLWTLPAARASSINTLGIRSLSGFFVENAGQFQKGVLFRARASGRLVDITEDGPVFRFLDIKAGKVHSVSMDLLGSKRVRPVGAKELKTAAVYDIPEGHFRAKTYSEVVYPGVYPGVTLYSGWYRGFLSTSSDWPQVWTQGL